MKITGTKKLLIIFFALVCALAAGIGVIITRSGVSGSVAYAETEVSASDAVAEEIKEEISAPEEEAEEPEENIEEEEFAEEEYDERFDENIIHQVADLLNSHYELVNLYCHAQQIDARELLARLIADEERVNSLPTVITGKGHTEHDEDIVAPDAASDYANEEEEEPSNPYYKENNEQIFQDIFDFQSDYMSGKITLADGAENNDWYIAPDELLPYAETFYYYGYNYASLSNRMLPNTSSFTSIPTAQIAQARTIHHPNTVTNNSTGAQILYWQYYLNLKPGETFTIKRQAFNNTGWEPWVSYESSNPHFLSDAVNQILPWYGESHWTIDGDAPSGTAFWIYFNFNLSTSDTSVRGYRARWCWYAYNSTYNYRRDVTNNDGNYAPRSNSYLSFKFVVKRTSPPSPKLIDDTATNKGNVNFSTNTKTAFYLGTPVVITMSNDFGAGIISYTYDAPVTLKSRSEHGKEGTGGKNIQFQCSTAGKYEIILKIVQPTVTQIAWPSTQHAANSNSGTMVPTKMSWSDTTATEIKFTLIVQTQNINKPSMVEDEWYAGYGRKIVNYTGEVQTITIENVNKDYVGYSSSLHEQSWTNNRLILEGTDRGTYSVYLYLLNPDGVTWGTENDNDTNPIEYTLIIKEMPIERPTQVGSASYTKTVKYDSFEQTMKLSPANEDQLLVIPSTGVKYDFNDDDGGTCVVRMTNSGTVKIIVMPADGYVWKDTKTQEQIIFTFTIEAVEIEPPKIQGYSGTSQTVTFDPAPNWAAKLVLENIPKDAINVITALQYTEDDWKPAAWDSRGEDVSEYSDVERNVLTLSASNANTYDVIFTLKTNNYRWKTEPKKFSLTIKRYVLQHPRIDQYEYDNNADKIEGATKTVYYNEDPKAGNYTDNDDKYFKIYAGGFTKTNQVSIRYSANGLRAEWPNADAENPTPDLELWGTTTTGSAGPAGNYIIYITPTSNYIWETGNDDMYTFKFVISPILRDQLRMYTLRGDDPKTGSWGVDSGDRTGSADYDGKTKYFRIGTPDSASQFFYDSQCRYDLVNSSYSPISSFGGFKIGIDNDYDPIDGQTPTVLLCSAVEAGTYIVRLQLRNTNYAWRDGSGVDIYYTFTIKAQSIKDPQILGSECSGGSEGSLQIYDTYIHCGYNGFAAQLVIGVPNIKDEAGNPIVKIFTNPTGLDVDEDGNDALQILDFGEMDEDGIARLILLATIVGDHRVLLGIEDSNYKWETDCEFYAFELRIDYAEVDDVMFNYGLSDDMQEIGGNGEWYEEDFNPDSNHYITITRSSNEFKGTPFTSQFIVEVNYGNSSYELKRTIVTDENYAIEFYDANIYYISVYLTNNYRWRSNHRQDTAVMMTFQVYPKYVSLPQIVADESSATVDNVERKKTVTYDSNTTQNITLDYGNDYNAYLVDKEQNFPSTLKEDRTVVASVDKKVRYTAKNAGTYKLALTLSDTNNYAWASGSFLSEDTVFYQLIIEQRAIAIPDAYYIDAADINNLHEDYLDIKNGKGEQLFADADGVFKTKQTYDTDLHYIYLFGYAVENKEVTITITPEDSSTVNPKDIDHGNVSVGGITRGHYAFARTVNTYTVSVAFNLNEEFNKPNCYWAGGVSMSIDTDPREYLLIIGKLGLALPELVDDPAQEWKDDSLSKHFTYDGAAKGPSVLINNCLSSLASTPYMSYIYGSRTAFERDVETNVGTFSISETANVGVDYILTIQLDPINEYWIHPSDDPDPDPDAEPDTSDVADKLIKIIIDKKGIARPVVVYQGDGKPDMPNKVVYGDDDGDDTVLSDLTWKSVIYNAEKWIDSLRVTGFDKNLMTWKPSDNATLRIDDTDKDMYLSTLSSNAGKYTVTITLKDPQNYKWEDKKGDSEEDEEDVEAELKDDSGDIVLTFIIEPKKIAKPTIVVEESELNPEAGASSITSSDDSTTLDLAKTIYMRDPSSSDLNNIKGKEQTIVIANFLFGDPDGSMSVITSSSDKFKTDSRDQENKLLIYTAVDAGTYTLKFSLSGNLAWDDDTGTADHYITLIISKKEYTAPEIDDPGAALTPAKPTVSEDGTTRTVTYNFNPQQLVIKNYDNKIMLYSGKTDNDETGEEFIDKNTASTLTTYTFEATGAGEYTVTFAKRNPTNECWKDVDGETITFKFVIEKLGLDIPVIDVDEKFLLKGEEATPSQFTTTYDTLRHSVLALNVLNTDYMTYRMGGYYNTTTAPTTFVISSEAIAKSYTVSEGDGTKTLKNINQIYNVNGTTKRNGAFKTDGINILTPVEKENFILMEATEPGTYEVVFTLANEYNLIWNDKTKTDKKVSFKINKVQLDEAPAYKSVSDKSKTYTGKPIQFSIINADNGKATATSVPAFDYETMSIRCVSSSTNESMKLVSWYGKELIVEATEIGEYEVKIYLNDKYVKWPLSTPVTSFTFSITKSAITPEISYGHAVYIDDPDTLDEDTTKDLEEKGETKWAKSRLVTATIALPNIRVKVGTGELDVDGIGIEVYYRNASKNKDLLRVTALVPVGVADKKLLGSLTAEDNTADLGSNWSVRLEEDGTYTLIYKYVIQTANDFANEDGTLKMGDYTLHVVQNNKSNSYTIAPQSKGFTIDADPSPFGEQKAYYHLIWEVYKASDTTKPFRTYALGDFIKDGVPEFTTWENGDENSMQPSHAILDLDYMEDDSYIIKVNFSEKGLNGESNFMDALSKWEVKWNGNYIGKANAKYASKITDTSEPYSVSIEIQAKNPQAFSFGPATYTFYYHIKPILYDLTDVVWDYDSKNPFTYDGSNHTVKLKNLPEGLSVASYDVKNDVKEYDRNVQIYAKSEADHGKDKYYETSVEFTTSNLNYVIPINNGKRDTYIDKNEDPGKGFQWTVKWEILKDEIKVKWNDERGDDDVSAYVPVFVNDREKVNLTYYKNVGGEWKEVKTFARTDDPTSFKIVVELKTSDDPALNYANNYKLDNDAPYEFKLHPASAISIELYLGNFSEGEEGEAKPDVETFKSVAYKIMPDEKEKINTFIYNEKPLNMYFTDDEEDAAYGIATKLVDVPEDESGKPTVVWDNIIITYYSTVNKYRPISAPTDPGHYFVRFQLKTDELPNDGISYELATTEFYFDIVKGTIDPELYYWRYTNKVIVDNTEIEIVAVYDGEWDSKNQKWIDGKWIIHHTSLYEWDEDEGKWIDPDDPKGYLINSEITKFVYNSKGHSVELVSEDKSILNPSTRNGSGKTEAGDYKSTASLSYNGKLWNAPNIPTTFDWKIEKKTLSLAEIAWADSSKFIYTVKGGVVKTFTMSVTGIDTLLANYISYETYKEDDKEKKNNISNTQSDAGSYVTELVFDKNFDDKNPNYQIGDDWPEDFKNPKTWSIAVREIEVPVLSGKWDKYDGEAHDLLTAITLSDESDDEYDWSDYFTIKVNYDNGSSSYAYDGTDNYGNEYFASHAGKYIFSFSLLDKLNTDKQTNVVWKIKTGLDPIFDTKDPDEVELEIAKEIINVDYWNPKDEASTAVLNGSYAIDYGQFVDYRFYKNKLSAPDIDIGDSVELIEVLTVEEDKQFVIEVYLKEEYTGDMDLVANLAGLQHAFRMEAPSRQMDDQLIVEKMPYIKGYVSGDIEYLYSDKDWKAMFVADTETFGDITEDNVDEWWLGLDSETVAINKSKIRVNATYNGSDVEFLVNNWDDGVVNYKDHLNIWQGSFTQGAAGDYSVTLMFKKDQPRCWSAEDNDGDGVAEEIDRSPVTLNFRISFKTIPTFKQYMTEDNFPTYNGTQFNIIEQALLAKNKGDKAKAEAEYDNWIAEYGKYFEIAGATGTDAGGYTLQLKIKDTFINMIRWDNGKPTGQAGTFVVKWRVLPIYVIDPMALVTTATLTYDAKSERTVYEVLGYENGGDATEEIKNLRDNAIITGDRASDAGTYTAIFSLSNTNYAWWNPTNNSESANQDPKRQITWIINQMSLDLTNIAWDYKTPFQYTLENGEAQPFEVKLTGVPEELEDFVSYLTDGDPENTRSEIGIYRTVVYFFENDVQKSKNYKLAGSYTKFITDYSDPEGLGFASIEWQIIEHRFSFPQNITVDYSGTLRDIVEDETLFGYAEGWENYLDVTIMYKEYGTDGDKYVSYYDIASVDKQLEYSMFKALYTGDYKVTFSIKPEVNASKVNVAWYDGNKYTEDKTAVLTIKPKVINIDGWTPVTEDGMQISATISSEDFDAMTEESKKLFTYVVRDKDTGKVIEDFADIIAAGNGIYYTVEFTLIDTEGYSAKYGFEIVWAEGVKNPYEFVNANYGAQPVIWIPLPSLTATSSDTYDGNDKVFNINNLSAYTLTADMKTTLESYGVDVENFGDTLIQAVGKNAEFVDLDEGTVTIAKAGDYSITFRQLPNVNISWYDPDDYEVNSIGKLCYKGGSALTNSDIASLGLINRYAQSVDVGIKKASLNYINEGTIELYISLIPDFEYTGKEYNLLKLKDTEELFKRITEAYGDLVTFEGYKATDAGEHILKIMLKDPDSSYWDYGVNVKQVVNDKSYINYDASYSLQYVMIDGKWDVRYVNAKGEEYNGGDYKIENRTYKWNCIIENYPNMDGLVDEDGRPLESGKYEVDENGVAVRYALVGGNYVRDDEGTYIAKLKLKGDGTPAQTIATDSLGRYVIDTEKTQVTITYRKTSTDPVEIPWNITTSSLSAPTVNEDITLYYNGADQRVESVLKGFNATYMEVLEGGVGKDVDTYTAKIGIKDENYKWRDGSEYVYVTWKIEKATIDWTGVTWKFTDGTKDYKNGEGMVYTRINDKATVYWVELANLPQALQGNIKFTTNGVPGAYAGRDAGKYLTTFSILNEENFVDVTIPESLSSVEWRIQRRVIDVPELGSTQFIFDDGAHDLLAMLKLPDGWKDYITINVQYASDFIRFNNYAGNNGNPYEAYGAGAYKFVVSFKEGVNTYNLLDSTKSQINVVWAKSEQSELPNVPPVTSKEEAPQTQAPVKLKAVTEAPVEEVEVLSEVEEVSVVKTVATVTETVQAVTASAKTPAVMTEIQHVCDRIKKLVCCTESQLKEFRKQY